MTVVDDRFGTGWAFPPRPDEDRALDWLRGPDLVRQSILLVLDTEPGERVMRPDFGCGLRRFLMEPNSPSTRAAIGREVEAALQAWEPRITLTTVDVLATGDPSVVLLSIGYVHVRDQRADTVQVPFTLAGPGGGA